MTHRQRADLGMGMATPPPPHPAWGEPDAKAGPLETRRPRRALLCVFLSAGRLVSKAGTSVSRNAATVLVITFREQEATRRLDRAAGWAGSRGRIPRRVSQVRVAADSAGAQGTARRECRVALLSSACMCRPGLEAGSRALSAQRARLLSICSGESAVVKHIQSGHVIGEGR